MTNPSPRRRSLPPKAGGDTPTFVAVDHGRAFPIIGVRPVDPELAHWREERRSQAIGMALLGLALAIASVAVWLGRAL